VIPEAVLSVWLESGEELLLKAVSLPLAVEIQRDSMANKNRRRKLAGCLPKSGLNPNILAPYKLLRLLLPGSNSVINRIRSVYT